MPTASTGQNLQTCKAQCCWCRHEAQPPQGQVLASCRSVPAVLSLRYKNNTCGCVAGAGAIPATDLALMRAHIMAWLLYTTPAQLQRQLGAFGLDIAEQPDLLELLQSELAGSFPVLRCLAQLDAGEKSIMPK